MRGPGRTRFPLPGLLLSDISVRSQSNPREGGGGLDMDARGPKTGYWDTMTSKISRFETPDLGLLV